MTPSAYTDRPVGDPDGRRSARKESLHLAEAGRVARALETFMRRAGMSPTPASEIAAALQAREAQALMKSEGRIESRKRFKYNSGTPLHEGRPLDLLFVDESGRADPKSLDPVFAVGAVSMSAEAHTQYVASADLLKQEFFGRTDVTFHEPKMRTHADEFEFKHDLARQVEFCTAVDSLVSNTSFIAFGAVIRKKEFASFLIDESDPYLPPDLYGTAIHMLMERYVDSLASDVRNPRGRVVFESVGPREDAEHHADYIDLLLSGTQWVPDSAFRNWLETGVQFVRKQGSHGSEIADMVARDLFEWVRLGCPEDVPRRLGIIGGKIYRRDDMRMGKFGVKVFPDADIKDLIDAHRRRCAEN